MLKNKTVRLTHLEQSNRAWALDVMNSAASGNMCLDDLDYTNCRAQAVSNEI
jgi:hypothetical protein